MRDVSHIKLRELSRESAPWPLENEASASKLSCLCLSAPIMSILFASTLLAISGCQPALDVENSDQNASPFTITEVTTLSVAESDSALISSPSAHPAKQSGAEGLETDEPAPDVAAALPAITQPLAPDAVVQPSIPTIEQSVAQVEEQGSNEAAEQVAANIQASSSEQENFVLTPLEQLSFIMAPEAQPLNAEAAAINENEQPDQPTDTPTEKEGAINSSASVAEPVETVTSEETDDGTPVIESISPLLTFGNPVAAYGLANQTVGRASLNTNSVRRVAYGFIATSDAYITSLRQYVIWSTARTGYHGGTGGKLQIDIVNDDTGNPGNSVISTGVFTPDVGVKGGYFDMVAMSGGNLEVGKRYWVRYTQSDSQPLVNWVSVNALNKGAELSYNSNGNGVFFAHMIKTSDDEGEWVSSPHLGIYEIGYADGVFQGNGYISSHAFNSQHYIGGLNKVRQKFVPDRGLELDSLNVRVARVAGSDDLIAVLKNSLGDVIWTSSSNELILAEVDEHHWVSFPISGSIYLMQGEEYSLELSAATGTHYFSYPSQSGNSYGFSLASLGFAGSDMELSIDNGGGWSGWTYDGRTNRQYQEMSMFLSYR